MVMAETTINPKRVSRDELEAYVLALMELMTPSERAGFMADLAEEYCRRCGRKPVKSRRADIQCECGLGYWE